MADSAALKKGVSVADGLFVLRVSKDGMEAVLQAADEKIGASLDDVDTAALMEEVRGHGVVFGLLDPPQKIGAGHYAVARGRPPAHGDNAKVKAYVKPAVVHAPKIKKKDQVDYRELGSIVNVPKDKLLLEKIPPTPGTPGTTVTGEEVAAKLGRDITLKVGKGVTLTDDGMKVYAAVEGKYMLADGKASVGQEHTVQGDVDLASGNIAFVGQRLTINGSVLPGFKVKCKGDVYIAMGVQNGAVITAGGNLEIKGGAVGEDVVLLCWRTIHADFFEGVGRIEVKGDLVVDDTLIQCNARVGGNMRVTGGKGSVIGGHFLVGGSLYVRELGSDAEVQTHITVGMNPELDDRRQTLEKEQDTWSDKMAEVLKTVTAMENEQKENGPLPPEKMEVYKKLKARMPQLMDKVSQLTEQQMALEEEMAQAINEAVYVYGTVYPGCTISIAGAVRSLTSPEESVVIHFDQATRQIHCRAMTPEEKNAVSEG